jgi:hypothetical protein
MADEYLSQYEVYIKQARVLPRAFLEGYVGSYYENRGFFSRITGRVPEKVAAYQLVLEGKDGSESLIGRLEKEVKALETEAGIVWDRPNNS